MATQDFEFLGLPPVAHSDLVASQEYSGINTPLGSVSSFQLSSTGRDGFLALGPYLSQSSYTPDYGGSSAKKYRMAGYVVSLGIFEYWDATNSPNSNNPSGLPIQNVYIVSVRT